MRRIVSAAVLSAALLVPVQLFAEVLELKPASPQPTSVSPGLAVNYAFRARGRSLSEARDSLRDAEPGAPIPGLTYEDEPAGSFVLTSKATELVAADISGYIKFDRPGTYVFDFLTNDGLDIRIGGQQVGLYDGIHACGY